MELNWEVLRGLYLLLAYITAAGVGVFLSILITFMVGMTVYHALLGFTSGFKNAYNKALERKDD